ncbi:MAG: hypothetical protein V2A77_05075 [Pseudomonadota bacterium]
MTEKELAEAKERNNDLQQANHAHHWTFEKAERGISLGSCSCGAHRYFADSTERDFLERAGVLNAKLAKKQEDAGLPASTDAAPASPAPAAPPATRHTARRIGRPPADQGEEPDTPLPPVPPRPDTGGKKGWVANNLTHAYYVEHDAQIREEARLYGGAYVRRRWGIPAAVYSRLMAAIPGKAPAHGQAGAVAKRAPLVSNPTLTQMVAEYTITFPAGTVRVRYEGPPLDKLSPGDSKYLDEVIQLLGLRLASEVK